MKKTNDKSRKETIDILLKSYIFKYVIPIVFIGVLLICLINRGAFVLGENQKLNTNEVINTIWDGTLEVGLSSLAIIEIIVFVYFCKNRIYSKKPLVIIAIALWIAIVFNSIVMDIPMAIGFVALANFSLIIIIVIASLYILPEESTIQTLPYDTALYKAISTTENRRIISVQMYKAIAQYKSSGNNEKIIYTVESGRSFNRKGYDINSIKTIEYELDRKIVDTFQTILYSYKDFLKDENDNTRDNLIALINVEINALNDKLLCIETENRTITKEDCCIARVLILYLAIRYSLIRNKDENVTYANYVGEISLRDGDLNLKEETEKKLFSLVRTGLLGAILVGEDLRHVFFYRKDGVKKGRKYCASTITCTNNEDKGETVNQVLNVCLFTVEVPNTNAIPGYVFDSIQNREKLIKEVLERKENGDK